MGHLNPAELIELAEGMRDPRSLPHLQVCAECRRQLDELREVMSAAASAQVPEPPPFFWESLSARVRAKVDAEGDLQRRWWRPSTWPRLAVPVLTGAVAAVIMAVGLSPHLMAPIDLPNASAPLLSPAGDQPAAVSADDPALDLVVELVSQMDWESAVEIEPALHPGALEEAFDELSDAERREMQLLLGELEKGI